MAGLPAHHSRRLPHAQGGWAWPPGCQASSWLPGLTGWEQEGRWARSHSSCLACTACLPRLHVSGRRSLHSWPLPPLCKHTHPSPTHPRPALPQFYNVERKWRRKLEGAMEADRTVGGQHAEACLHVRLTG